MKKRFKDQVVIITGASSGIGRASAIAFSGEGATVVLVARRKEKLEEVAGHIVGTGGKAVVITADVSDRQQVKAVIREVSETLGKINVFFNNAGTSYVGPVDGERFIEDTVHMFEVDFLGTVYGVTEVLPVMKKQGYGHIINMSSVVGIKAFPKFGGYSSMMHAISGFTDSLRQELSGTDIGVSIIHPGLTQTALLGGVDPGEMPPPFRFMTPIAPETVAGKILDGIYHKRRKIVVPAQPRLLLFLDALSTGIGDRFVKMVSNRSVAKIIGLYRGRSYHDQTPLSTD